MNTKLTRAKTGIILFMAITTTLTAIFIASEVSIAKASEESILSGIVVGVETDSNGKLIRLAVSDSSGQITTFEFSPKTQFGLENEAGDRWISSLAENPSEAARRLNDHRKRFAPITVSHANGIASSIVERQEGKLETNLGYLFAVFATTWILFFAYVLYMGQKQRVLQYEITRLKNQLE
ncbi:MAG: hypothetical protein CL791_05785 [Chloroflexi bacterium]|nr:hypothetical protein [Chloroflexota bacterium]